ncbi:hypothetical protein B296_00010631 [Ensete ventricosum]|uniref:Uncharacterized protein n=1 Tax=Ensete ventricosum TaxID=4639 RepID=A0A426Z7K9_ENSVE|nr:hypothetical protein B296_00010631 [Ensete ventricosum]
MEHTGASSRRLERSPRDGDRRLLHPRRPGAIKSTIIYISIVLHGSQRIHLFLRLVIWLQSVFDRVLWLAHTRGAAGSTRPPVEDSYVYVWKREPGRVVSAAGKGKGWTTTRSHEYFYCKDVSVAIPWPSAGSQCSPLSLPSPASGRFDRRAPQQDPLDCTDSRRSTASLEDIFHSGRSPAAALSKKSFSERGPSSHREEFRSVSRWGIGSDSFASGGPASSVVSDPGTFSPSFSSWGWYSGDSTRTSSTDPPNAWGLVVVTAGLGGHIRIYQNFGLPLRLSRQTNLF